MKANLLYILIFLFGGNLAAQNLLVEPDEINLSGLPTEEDFDVYIKLTNTTSGPLSALWTLDRQSIPDAWEFSVCDKVTCYAFGIEAAPSSKPNEFAAGESFLCTLKIAPNGVEAVEDIRMTFFSSVDQNDIYADFPVAISVMGPSNTTGVRFDEINVYPNPTQDLFQISEDDGVAMISVHNVLGKKMYQNTHIAGRGHNVADLPRGIYMVRMFDESGKMRKVLRLSKR